MNLAQLRKQLGKPLRLRPLPVRLDTDGTRLGPRDDAWRLQELMDNPARIRLINQATGHFVELGSDNVKEFRTPDFLLLRCELWITNRGVELEPTHSVDSTFARLEQQMPELLQEMRMDLAQHPLWRVVVVLSRSWPYWGRGEEFAYFFEEHPDLRSKVRVLCSHGLLHDISSGNVERYELAEELVKYLNG